MYYFPWNKFRQMFSVLSSPKSLRYFILQIIPPSGWKMPCSFPARRAGEIIWWDPGTGLSPWPGPCSHHPWIPKDRRGPCPGTLYKPLLMSWGFDHHPPVCLDILLLPIFCFVFLLTPEHPKRQMMSLLMTLAAWQEVPRMLCSPCLLPYLQWSQRAAFPSSAACKMHPAKCIQALQGPEIRLQEPHKSPGFLRSLATAAGACSRRPPPPRGTWGKGDVKQSGGGLWACMCLPMCVMVGGSAGMRPINSTAAVQRALLFHWFSPDSVIWRRKLCLT